MTDPRALAHLQGDEPYEPSCLTPVWLVWAMNDNGILGLRGIASNQTTATRWKVTLECDFPAPIRVWIDKTQLDHLYAKNLTIIRYGR